MVLHFTTLRDNSISPLVVLVMYGVVDVGRDYIFALCEGTPLIFMVLGAMLFVFMMTRE